MHSDEFIVRAVHDDSFRLAGSRWNSRFTPFGIGSRMQLEGVFIAHSMGGLLLKQMLRRAFDNPKKYGLFLRRASGIAFLSTPSAGAHIAGAIGRLVAILPKVTTSKAMRDLEHASPYLAQLSEWYQIQAGQSLCAIQHVVFYETKPTFGSIIVDQPSANPGLTGVEMHPVGANHMEIAKPRDRDSFVYLTVLDFLRRLPPMGQDVVLSADGRTALSPTTEHGVADRNATPGGQAPLRRTPAPHPTITMALDALHLHLRNKRQTRIHPAEASLLLSEAMKITSTDAAALLQTLVDKRLLNTVSGQRLELTTIGLRLITRGD